MSTKTEGFITRLLDLVARHDAGGLADLVGEPVVLHTPRFLRPVTDRRHVSAILQGFITVVPDLHYRRWWATDDEAILQFEGHVTGTATVVHGIDLFTVGADGRFTELTVFLRPTRAIEAIGALEDAEVRTRLG
ncbi:MAG: nuclear transport factor 2 family protein [Gammaproteobacteria bacterium]|nr:nuclear transport factor 2 family protein [Gammaproteobacteria bacterium]